MQSPDIRVMTVCCPDMRDMTMWCPDMRDMTMWCPDMVWYDHAVLCVPIGCPDRAMTMQCPDRAMTMQCPDRGGVLIGLCPCSVLMGYVHVVSSVLMEL